MQLIKEKSHIFQDRLPNDLRYQLVGRTRHCHFDRTSFEPRKLLENAHAVKQQSHHYSSGARAGVVCTPCWAAVSGERIIQADDGVCASNPVRSFQSLVDMFLFHHVVCRDVLENSALFQVLQTRFPRRLVEYIHY